MSELIYVGKDHIVNPRAIKRAWKEQGGQWHFQLEGDEGGIFHLVDPEHSADFEANVLPR